MKISFGLSCDLGACCCGLHRDLVQDVLRVLESDQELLAAFATQRWQMEPFDILLRIDVPDRCALQDHVGLIVMEEELHGHVCS